MVLHCLRHVLLSWPHFLFIIYLSYFSVQMWDKDFHWHQLFLSMSSRVPVYLCNVIKQPKFCYNSKFASSQVRLMFVDDFLHCSLCFYWGSIKCRFVQTWNRKSSSFCVVRKGKIVGDVGPLAGKWSLLGSSSTWYLWYWEMAAVSVGVGVCGLFHILLARCHSPTVNPQTRQTCSILSHK